jgi:hypothetical protein
MGSEQEDRKRQALKPGAGDKLHPNRAGCLALAWTIDLDLLFPAEVSR